MYVQILDFKVAMLTIMSCDRMLDTELQIVICAMVTINQYTFFNCPYCSNQCVVGCVGIRKNLTVLPSLHTCSNASNTDHFFHEIVLRVSICYQSEGTFKLSCPSFHLSISHKIFNISSEVLNGIAFSYWSCICDPCNKAIIIALCCDPDL